MFVAVPVTVNGIVTVWPEAAESWAVTVIDPLSFTLAWFAAVHCTVTVVSSSVMVAVCTVVPLAVALVGVPIVRITVSLPSLIASPVIVIVAVAVVEPALIVIGLAVIV
jgi:hypothetical protein